MEKSLLENAAVGKDSYKMTVKKAFFFFFEFKVMP